ncbi:MAG: MarR family transcriptional regulator, partial [archaeon]
LVRWKVEPISGWVDPNDQEFIRIVCRWASQLTAESRYDDYAIRCYSWPPETEALYQQLANANGAVIALVGVQGIGKSSALRAILKRKLEDDQQTSDLLKKAGAAASGPTREEVIFFKWRRESELFSSLLEGTHDASQQFCEEYRLRLLNLLLPYYQKQLQKIKDHPERLSIEWAEKVLGRNYAKNLRRRVWCELLFNKKIILVDLPDYSKTDRRLMARDLSEVQWFWNSIQNQTVSLNMMIPIAYKSNIVVAIQKDLFEGHFFFDKMQKVELKPLKAEQMIKVYQKHFQTLLPFNEEALLLLSRMSRGIFRQFLRYMTLTLEYYQTVWTPFPITAEQVQQAIPPSILAEHLDDQLAEVFPRQPELRTEAARLIQHLQTHGPADQTELTNLLGLRDYSVSRMLTKLEEHHYIKREKRGLKNTITLET